MWYIAQDAGSVYIAHHGILGQKWGIRRYQNKDGSLTAEGKKRAMMGREGIEKIRRKGENKSSSKRISTRILGGSIKGSLTGAGLATGAALGDAFSGSLLGAKYGIAAGPIGIAAGTVGGGILGASVGGAIKSAIQERGKMKAGRIKRQYDELADLMNDHYEKNKATTGKKNVTDEEAIAVAKKAGSHRGDNYKVYRSAMSGDKKAQKIVEKWESQKKTPSVDKEVARARKTGKYDMEFLESGLDIDERTGESLEGKALDDAYRKFLKERR